MMNYVSTFTICPNRAENPFYLDPACKTSIYTGVKTVEQPNTELINGFLNHKMGINFRNVANYKCVPYKAESNQITAYLKLRDSATDVYETKWKLPTHGWGRIQPDKHLSLSVFHRPTRHAFCTGRYIDLDEANSHPQFILGILQRECQRNSGMTCANLGEYVADPKGIRAAIMEFYGVDKNAAKQLPISLLNGGCCKQWKIDNKVRTSGDLPLMKALEKELKVVIDCVWHDNQQIHIDFTNAKDSDYLKKTDAGKKRAVMASFCQTVERITQERSIMAICDTYGIPLAQIIPCQDGCMIPIRYEPLIPEMTLLMESACLESLGLVVKWTHKPFDEADTRIPAEPELSMGKPSDTVAFDNDREAAEYIYESLKTTFVYSRGEYYMRMKNHVWSSDEKQIRVAVFYAVNQSDIYRPGSKEGEFVPYTQNAQSAKNVATVLMSLAVNNENHEFDSLLFQSSLGYTLFRNGYLNWRTGVFTPLDHPEFDDSILFTEIIPYDFKLPTATPEEASAIKKTMDYIKQKLFYTPFGEEMGDYYILNLARAMAGDCMKRFLFGIGLSNTGKSLLTAAIHASCGGYYKGFSATNITSRNSSQDEAQLLRWAMLLRHKRIIISNEIKKGTPLDGNMIKKLSNGGLDDLTGRGHGGNETNFKVAFLPITFANDIDMIRPYDDAVITRVHSIPYTKICVDKSDTAINPLFEIKKDPHLMTEIETPEFKQAFISVLVESYTRFCDGGRLEVEPAGVLAACKDTFGDNRLPIDFILDEFEFTNNPADFVTSSELSSWMEQCKVDISATKLGIDLRLHALSAGYDKAHSGTKTIRKKSTRGWFGIRRILYEDDAEEVDPFESLSPVP